MRKPVISRTITSFSVKALLIDKNTHNTEERLIAVPKVQNIEGYIKKLLKPEENIVFVNILDKTEVKEKYVMDVDIFMELARPADENDVEVE